MDIDEVKRKMRTKTKKEIIQPDDYLSTGSTLLDLACSDNPYGGFVKGKYLFLVGDSMSGKTFLSITCLAEASINPSFKEYSLIYDNAEDGALMDLERFFGTALAKRIKAPAVDENGSPLYSSSIEDFYYNIDDALNSGPCIYLLDSMDALTSEQEQEKFQETKKAHREGKDTSGSFGDGKAKKNSSGIRQLLEPLRETGSILIIINQTRDNLGFGFSSKTRSGGRALRFYSTLEMWSEVKGEINKTVRGKKRQIGVQCRIKVVKNRITGKRTSIEVPIFHSYGIDDIGSCIDYLCDEGRWKGKGGKINLEEDWLTFSGMREKLINIIEEEELQDDLKETTGETWAEIQEACSLKRKKRY